MSAEWVRVELDAVEKYGADAAVVLGLIAYRCNVTGEWEAAVTDLVHETRLTDHRVRAALRVLRDTGAVHAHRADRFRSLLTWSVSAGHTENGDSPITRLPISPPHETGKSHVPSYTENQELPLVVPTPDPPAAKSAKSTRRATSLPADFRPSSGHWDLAARLGVDLRQEGPQFVDHHTAKGSTMKDWDAALRTWIRNAARYAAQRQGPKSIDAPASTWTGTDGHAVALPPPRTDPFAAGGY